MKHTVVITGGTGKVGIPIVQCLLRAGYHVHMLVRSQLPVEHPLIHKDVTLTVMDLTTLSEQNILAWLNRLSPQALIHAAALADAPGCERQPALAYLMNATTTAILAKACAVHKIHFILLSTEYVFDGMLSPKLLYHEDDRVNPLNHYGKSKSQGEKATQEICDRKTPWAICRTSVVYGTTQNDRPDFVQWVRIALQHKQSIQVAIDQINSPTYVLDLARILVTMVQKQAHGIYHVAGKTPISRYHFAHMVAQQWKLNTTLIQPILTPEVATEIRRPLNAGLCVDKIIADVGVIPLTLSQGLFFTKNP